MQTINKVILAVLAAGGLFYGWSKQQSSAEYDRQVGALATTLDRRFISPATPAAQAEAMFLRAMVIFSDYRMLRSRGDIRMGEEQYLKDVLSAAGYTSNNRGITVILRTQCSAANSAQQTTHHHHRTNLHVHTLKRMLLLFSFSLCLFVSV